MQRARLPYILIPIAAFVAIIPLLANVCSCGHDFDFHILNWFEAARQFTHGNLHPHWAYTPAYNAGEPRFVFYPPLSWTIGAILGLLFPWTWTPILYTWLALTASGLALYRLARAFAAPTAALLAATFYTVNPYMLFTAYERTAYAELLAAAWIPLLLHAILRKHVTIARIAIPITLLWLTNAPAAVMSCYALALLTALRLAIKPAVLSVDSSGRSYAVSSHRIGYSPGGPSFAFFAKGGVSRGSATAPAHLNSTPTPSQTRLQLALNTIAGTTIGLGLAAFYILPAAHQRRYVQIAMAIIPFYRIQDNFLFHHTPDTLHDQVLHTASLIAIILIASTATVLSITLLRRNTAKRFEPALPDNLSQSSKDVSSRPNPERASRVEGEVERPPHFVDIDTTSNIPLLLAILTIAITLSLTPLTSFIWNHVPELAFLQFPWRLVAILAAVLCLAIALALSTIKLKPAASAVIVVLAAAILTYPAYTVFHQACDEEDTVEARLALFHSNQGTDPTDEYTPTTADNDSLAQNNPPYWLSIDPNAKAPSNSHPGPAPNHLTLNSATSENLILNLRDYPAWRVTLSGTLIPTRLHRDDGLIALPIPAGHSTIDIAYAKTLDQTLGDVLSLISLALLLFFVLRPPTQNLSS